MRGTPPDDTSKNAHQIGRAPIANELLPHVPRERVPAVEPVVRTPLGPLTFAAALGGRPLPGVPDTLWRLPSGARIARWAGPDADLELLLTAYLPEPTGFSRVVTEAWAAVWHLRAHRTVRRPAPAVRLADPPPGTESGYGGGQYLAALEITGAGHDLALAGEDAEAICRRAADGTGVPARWAGESAAVEEHRHGWGEEYRWDRHALHWTLPDLLPGEHLLLPVATAWLPAGPDDDTSALWAADLRLEVILAAAVGPGLRG
ncbi:hypothetical protein [Kitasatospora sp. CB02891]|uniref:hypothetical protein n=1 Tax=Kitasatospora sp. CB02891 TaxID=2020329 RepID=UPI000C276529|nr:hypothetical protein [Kitasatospora sp. CB02891]PJN28073.1 hypothetical protein CG736_07795 [Kitasatospora sp. CB02891]